MANMIVAKRRTPVTVQEGAKKTVDISNYQIESTSFLIKAIHLFYIQHTRCYLYCTCKLFPSHIVSAEAKGKLWTFHFFLSLSSSSCVGSRSMSSLLSTYPPRAATGFMASPHWPLDELSLVLKMNCYHYRYYDYCYHNLVH